MIKKILEQPNFEMFFITFLVLLFPVFSIPVVLYEIVKEEDLKKKTIYTAYFCLIMAYLAFHTVPFETDDLMRHFENMEILQDTPFLKIFFKSYTGVYLNTLIMYIFSKTGFFGLYPAFYVLLGYFLVIFNIIRIQKRQGIQKKEVFWILLFVLFSVNCRDFISGLRNYFAFIIVSYAIISCLYFHSDKRITYLILFLAGFIHTAAFIILFLFILDDLHLSKKIKKRIQILILFSLPISIFLANGLFYIAPFLKEHPFLYKLYTYITTPNIFNINVYLFYLGILFVIVCCHLFNKKHEQKEFMKINSFLDFYLAFMIALSPMLLLLTRFLYFLIPFSPIVLVQTFKNLKNNNKAKCMLKGVLSLFVLAGILLLLASIRSYTWQFDKGNIFFFLLG